MKTKLIILSSNDKLFNLPIHEAISNNGNIDIQKIYILKEKNQFKKKIKVFILLSFFDYFRILKKIIESIFKKKKFLKYEKLSNINSVEFVDSVNKMTADLVICINCPQILKEHTINEIRLPIYNFHPGDIPSFRGVLIPYFILKESLNKACMTFHKIDKNIDSGTILNKNYIYLSKNDNIFSIYEKIFLSRDSIKFIITCIINHNNFSNIKNSGIDRYFTYPSLLEIIKFRFGIKSI